jgi:predicted alpha-1,2-mannosidase
VLVGKYHFTTQPICAIVLSSLMISAGAFSQTSSSYDAVDPFIGTIGGGNTFPGASLPFGMIQWSPDTTTGGWYRYNQNKVYGFSLTHISGAGCPLYADFPFLPLSDASMTDELTSSPAIARDNYAIGFDHRSEEAHPGYYTVTLANGVNVALTVTSRAGIARITFPQGGLARLLINAGGSADTNVHNALYPPVGREHDGSEITVESEDEVSGSVTSGGFCGTDSRYTLYFAARFQKPFQHFGVWNGDAIEKNEREAKGKHTGAWLDFGSDQPEVLMKVGISYVSTKNARDNLNKELPGWNFDSVHSDAMQAWVKMLDHITAEGGTRDQGKIFYTGLYHMLLSPTLFSDSNGDYIGFDSKVRSLAGARQRAQYANFSDWDIYRNPIQLQALLMPSRVSDMMQSLVNDAEQSGWLPNWEAANDVTYVMGGDSPAAFITSAYAFGARNFDTAAAFKYLWQGATQPGIGPHDGEQHPFLADYLKYGYVPQDRDGMSASRALEYANDDFVIAQFARPTWMPTANSLPSLATGATSSIRRQNGSARRTRMEPG